MKAISLFLKSFLFLVTTSFGQEISRQEADSMINILRKTKPGIDRIELLLNLAQFHIFKAGENKIDLDSAAVYIHEAKALNNNVNSTNAYGYLLLTESYLVKERGPKISVSPYFTSEQSRNMAEKAIEILQSGSNKDYLGQAYYELSLYYDYWDSLQASKKIELLNRSVDAFQKAGDLKRKGMSLEMLGDLYSIWGEQDKSSQTLKDALSAYNTVNYPKLQGIYVLMGRTCFFKHDHAPALSYLLKALKIAQSFNASSKQFCQINNYLGVLYSDIDRLDMAVKYLNDALELARKNNDESDIFDVVLNLSYAYNNAGQPAQSLKVLGSVPKQFVSADHTKYKLATNLEYFRAYIGLLQLKKALPYCDLLVNIADNKLNHDDYFGYDYNRKALIYMYVANFYFLSGNYPKARYYLAKNSAIANKVNYDFVQVHSLELCYKLDSAERNFKSAFNHLLRYKEKTDSLSGEKKQSQFQALNVEYEVEMKEDSIRLKDNDIVLLTQKNHLQQENLRQAALIRNITIAGIILAFIVMGLLYRQYRHKQKNNEVITQKNEQLQHLLAEKDWLVKEIHHRVKNNLQMVISLLNAQTEFLTHPSALNAIRESRERMQAIAIIHQKLYQLDSSTAVNMRSYVNELADNIKSSFADSERIHFKVDVADVCLDISQSVSLGLILNEAITNAVKYAYPKNEEGLIQISLKHDDMDKLQLKITDHGKGLPADVDTEYSNSLGMQLIRLFSEQLDGDLYFINNNGLEIILTFKTAGYNEAVIKKITA